MEKIKLFSDNRLEEYYNLLTDWNKRINLTSITNREEVFLKHFYDSVLPIELIPNGSVILDIGSGAGFPGIVLKIANPTLDITMLDSVAKKVNFLNIVINELKLNKDETNCLVKNGIRAIHCRAEDFTKRNFDIVVFRAVASLATLVEYSLPFLKIGGMMIAYKSSAVDEEITQASRALNILGGQIEQILYKNLTDDIMRSFVLIKKIKETPAGYPRKNNKPRSKPL